MIIDVNVVSRHYSVTSRAICRLKVRCQAKLAAEEEARRNQPRHVVVSDAIDPAVLDTVGRFRLANLLYTIAFLLRIHFFMFSTSLVRSRLRANKLSAVV